MVLTLADSIHNVNSHTSQVRPFLQSDYNWERYFCLQD